MQQQLLPKPRLLPSALECPVSECRLGAQNLASDHLQNQHHHHYPEWFNITLKAEQWSSYYKTHHFCLLSGIRTLVIPPCHPGPKKLLE